MALFHDGLLPASFRAVPFAVRTTDEDFGRRIALHQYPGRDEPWAEDMGRRARRFRLRGFLVTGDLVYGGAPVVLQRLLLIAAAEKAGPGTLTHPTLGILTVSVESLSVGEEQDAGRYSEIDFSFVEAGKQKYPNILTSGGGILSAGVIAALTIATGVVGLLKIALQSGESRSSVGATSHLWSAHAAALGGDATALHSLAAQLPGNFGRFSQGGNRGYAGAAPTPYDQDTTIADLIASASAQRVAITAAAIDLEAVVAGLGVSTSEEQIGPAIQAVVEALLAACADPSDAIRLLVQLLANPVAIKGEQTIGGQAIRNAFRLYAVIALAHASASYQPSSYDDALATLRLVAGRIDAAIVEVADLGQDATFDALRQLRAAVIDDLRARGAALSPIAQFNLPAPVPALALAQRLYRDGMRADQLVTQVDPVHPLFMPPAFTALAA